MNVDFEDLTHSDSTATILVTSKGRIISVNAEAARALALRAGDDLLSHLAMPPEEASRFLKACTGSREAHVGRLDFRQGQSLRSMRCDGALLKSSSSGDQVTIVLRLRSPQEANSLFAALTEQITELNAEIIRRRRAEANAQQALAEKDVLLREVQHRVRNNMQLIASMVELEARRSPSAQDALSEVGSRVRAIALAQEQLYERESVSDIELAAYLQSLVRAIEALQSGEDIVFSFSGDLITVPLDKAVPLGLIVNELLTNAAKHGFPEGRRGRVRVQLSAINGALIVDVTDDGVGLPPGVSLEKARSLGFRLMRQLAAQAGATIQVDGSPGVRASVALPVPTEKDAHA